MSTATVANAPAPKQGKKKLIIIIAAVALVLTVGGGAATFMLKKKPADVEAEADGEAGETVKAKSDPKHVPVFVPLDPFTVNLADRDAERYAQVGITLEIEDAKVGDQIKAFMPAIRNNILLAIADRTAVELMDRDGKRALAERVRRETSRALGLDVPDEPDAAAEEDTTVEKKPKKKSAKKKAEPEMPVRAVHFSNFIIQ
ncbi:MAG: flagellar basal body-associated FliL family protein [Chitinophagaceae bacterium]|nr:flagellar basal body-associated FliL family protein [Rubrivivax sp.]